MVFVLDRHGKPLMPCTEKRARLLLGRGRARIHRIFPFTIRLIDRTRNSSQLQALRLKLDPGSKVTGMGLVRDSNDKTFVLNLFELLHRGKQISTALTKRRALRRRRRSTLRHRAPRFLNRKNKRSDWLAPSLRHRVTTISSWVKRLQKYAPIVSISCESVKFDTQALENPKIAGIQYQLGPLHEASLKELLLKIWGRKCSYCDTSHGPLNIEHIIPQARGGSNRLSNLSLACVKCNQARKAQPLKIFVDGPVRYAKLTAYLKKPLNDAAAVNITRPSLLSALQNTGLQLELADGKQTKLNRDKLRLPKTHALDAVCVGEVHQVINWQKPTLQIKCAGRGTYKRTLLNKFGFPRGYRIRQKRIKGFQTGDYAIAKVMSGEKRGTYKGRIAIRASGSFSIQTRAGLVDDINYKYFRIIQKADGYGYAIQPHSH